MDKLLVTQLVESLVKCKNIKILTLNNLILSSECIDMMSALKDLQKMYVFLENIDILIEKPEFFKNTQLNFSQFTVKAETTSED